MRVGICTNLDNQKGLQRDYELLAGLLRGWGHEVVGVHFRRDAAAPACDLLVFLETLEPRFFAAASRRWFVPNPEWWEPGRAAELDAVERVLCKTRDAHRIFGATVGDRAAFTGWIAEDRHDAAVPRRRAFLHTPGDSDMKGTAAVIEAWRRHRIEHPLVLVGPQAKRARKLPKSVEVHGRLDDAALRRLQNECAFHLCPSAYEGFGHTLHEALSVGAAILTTDAPPMGEVERAAARVAVARTEALRSATLHHVDADALAAAVASVAALPDNVLDDVRRDARAEFLAGNEAFVARLRDMVGEGTGAPAATPVVRSRPRPRLAICFPAHASAAPLLRRSVLALRAQTADPDLFEVVIGADGGDPDGILAAAVEPDAHPFRCRIVPSPRPRGEVPHRNHARNAAWRAAEAPLCWILDCDFTLPPEAVAHVLAEHDAALGRGVPAVFTTCLAGWGGVGPGDWLARSATWAESGDPAAFRDLLATWPEIDEGIYSGYPGLYAPGAPRSEVLPDLKEGMPIVWRSLLNVMGGFDEAFGEWGGDKEELVDRLKGMARAGLFEVRIVNSVRALHQPHERDPGAHTGPARARQQQRVTRKRLIENGAAWWRPQLEAARDALPDILAPLLVSLAAGPSPSAVAASVATALADDALAEAAAANVRDRWKGRGPVLVVGRSGPALERRLGREVLCVEAGAVDTVPPASCCAVVVIDALGALDDAGAECVAEAAHRAAVYRAPVVVIERAPPRGSRSSGRPPRFYQRLFGGADAVGQRRGADGQDYTVLRGRLR